MPHDPALAIRTGARLTGSRLTEQALATFDLAAKYSAALALKGITPKRLDECRALLAGVQKAGADRALTREEASLATDEQNRAFLESKDWIRTLLPIVENTFDHEPTVIDAFHAGPKIGSSVPRLIAALNDRVALTRTHLKELQEWGASPAFLKAGEDLLAKIRTIDGRQESLLKGLSKGVEEYYRQKGELFLAIKRINRAAKAAFVNDPAVRKQFNLDILYRGASTRKRENVVPTPA